MVVADGRVVCLINVVGESLGLNNHFVGFFAANRYNTAVHMI